MFHKNAAAKENYRFPVSSFQFGRWLRKSDGHVERMEYAMTPVAWRREAWGSGILGKPQNPCYCADKITMMIIIVVDGETMVMLSRMSMNVNDK